MFPQQLGPVQLSIGGHCKPFLGMIVLFALAHVRGSGRGMKVYQTSLLLGNVDLWSNVPSSSEPQNAIDESQCLLTMIFFLQSVMMNRAVHEQLVLHMSQSQRCILLAVHAWLHCGSGTSMGHKAFRTWRHRYKLLTEKAQFAQFILQTGLARFTQVYSFDVLCTVWDSYSFFQRVHAWNECCSGSFQHGTWALKRQVRQQGSSIWTRSQLSS